MNNHLPTPPRDQKDLMKLMAEAYIYKHLALMAFRILSEAPHAKPGAVFEQIERLRARTMPKFPREKLGDEMAEHIEQMFDEIQQKFPPQ